MSHYINGFEWNVIIQACSGFNSSLTVIEVNTLRPRQNGRHFADDNFKCILLNENVWIMVKNSLKFVPKVTINNIPALVQIMAWRRPGDKPLSEPMLVSLPTHICVTRSQWVKAWMGDPVHLFYMDVIIYPCPNPDSCLSNLHQWKRSLMTALSAQANQIYDHVNE